MNLKTCLQPAWRRLLLVGVVVSIVLHGAVLDFWRGMTSPEAASGLGRRPVALQARLQTGSADRLPEEPHRAPLSAVAPDEFVARRPIHAGVALRPERSSVARGMEVLPAVVAAPASEVGLRPLSQAEGLVAYRLALLAALEAAPARLIAPLQLSLAVSPSGTQLEIGKSSGDATLDQIWLERIRHAAKQAQMPSVLAGQTFALELEFWP